MRATRQVALVTGASSDIGRAAALALVDTGFNVIGTSRNTSRVAPLDGTAESGRSVLSPRAVELCAFRRGAPCVLLSV
ncbi:SDR family NAD(P)-dependent oxidoreductase [Frankia sp. Cr2]|uniref:SDR family NAD(P)-dependent oxidoreductase n=1 Tax=Frankia sp. Cr2 TaxID=3073932 RepID=UPI002AD21354|nr:SDR family NAD(P)-dependent oxidoreductase [Frankia sp. Cr2]